MKYAFYILSLFIISISISHARTISSFNDSDALTTISQFMLDVAEDMPESVRLSDKKIIIKDFSKCEPLSARMVLKDVEVAIKKVLRFYPDEDLPFEQALIDMEDYLNNQTFKKCLLRKVSGESVIDISYYVDATNDIYLRVDNVALKTEQN